LPVEARAALVGIAVGALAWFAPELVGGGDALTQRALDAKEAPVLIVMVFVVRFALGPVCYAAGTPGGLFAPMLVLGAQIGVVFGWVCQQWLPGDAASSTAYAVVGMAAFFTAVVRAPLTGIVLAVEMTGCSTLLLPMLTSCFAAMATATLLRSPPIYDSLKERVAKLESR
jgi:CIC family chloride channel protein